MAIRERLAPTKQQEQIMLSHNSAARFAWNIALEQRNLHQPWQAHLSGYDQKKFMTQARKEVPWLKAQTRIVQDEAILDLQQAFQNWIKNPGHFGRPTWRKRFLNEGFRVVGAQYEVRPRARLKNQVRMLLKNVD